MSVVLWNPSQERLQQANICRFLHAVERSYGPGLMSYPRLHEWSVRRSEEFWAAVWEFCQIRASRPWTSVVRGYDRMPGAHWFAGARLNFAENLLRYRDRQPALVFQNEREERRSLSYAELYERVAAVAAALRAVGIARGDRVAGYLPNLPEAVIAMLATASIGAIWSSCSPDFGTSGLLDRFGQIRPRLLFTADGYSYSGRSYDSLPRVAKLLEHLPEIEQVVVVPHAGEAAGLQHLDRAVSFEDFARRGDGSELAFEYVPFDHPLYILFSSGTTGVPKSIVHGAGGTLIQHLKELVLHTDLKRSDRVFYLTTCGWMMWNWLVSSLAVGATVVLYDGSPFYPRADRLFRLAEKEGITVFGTSAKYLSAAEKAGLQPGQEQDLSALKTLLSTGSPLAPEGFDFVYREIKEDLCLSSISGGTDLISCFALGNPALPVIRGELQCRGLGMDVQIYDAEGRAVIGEKGELVCASPFPSMPVGFWNDPDGRRYQAAYFERFPGVWTHGDYAELTSHGGMIIYGRSDAVLNPAGVRIGTAEIYRQVERLPEILEAVAVGQEWRGDIRIVLFVRLRAGLKLDHQLRARIRKTIGEQTSPRHVPARIIQVADIPRTRNGKVVELAVRNAIHHRPVDNLEALANPEALECFSNLPELYEN